MARLETQTPGCVPDPEPLAEGPGPTSSPGSLPAPHVAYRCSPVGFDRQQLFSAVCPAGCQSASFRVKAASCPPRSFHSSILGSFGLPRPESQAGLPYGPSSRGPFIVVSRDPRVAGEHLH
jgi:hypothetical protein